MRDAHTIVARSLRAVVGSWLMVGSYNLLPLIEAVVQRFLEGLAIPFDCFLLGVLFAEVISKLIRGPANTRRLGRGSDGLGVAPIGAQYGNQVQLLR